MLSVRPTAKEELRAVSADPIHATSQRAYTVNDGPETVAYIGVNTFSLVGTVGWPWVIMVRKDLLTARKVVSTARRALHLWAQEYDELRVCAEGGVNEKWFKSLGFVLDTAVEPIYADGRRMVQYRYGRQS
jgi:hypothetical protein